MTNKQHGRSLDLLPIATCLLALLVLPGCNPEAELANAQVDLAELNMQSIEQSLSFYQKKFGALPTTEQGLQALAEKPILEPIPEEWSQLYRPEGLIDPWGNSYRYESNPPETGFVIWSTGPDGVDGTEDDVRHESKS